MLGCLGILLACLPIAGAISQPVSDADLTIFVRPHSDFVDVHWAFNEPIEAFEFSGFEAERRSRLSDWQFAGEGWRFDGAILRREDGARFDRFTAQVHPTTTLRYPGYAVASHVGETGWVIHVGGLAPRQSYAFDVVFPDIPAENVVTGSGRTVGLGDHFRPEREFLYVGPRAYLFDQDEIRIVLAEEAATEALYGIFRQQLVYAHRRLIERLGPSIGAAPIVSVAYDPNSERPGIKGSVDRSFIALTVTGFQPSEFSSMAEGELLTLVTHEVFHLWNGIDRRRGQSPPPTWLVEGGAEYVSVLMASSGARRTVEIENRLNRCLVAIGPRSIRSSALASQGRTPYACGAVVMMLADAAIRQSGQHDILNAWRSVLQPDENGVAYDALEFYRAVGALTGEDAFQVSARISDGWQMEDTPDFFRLLDQAGVVIRELDVRAEEVPDQRLAVDVLRAVLRGGCDGQFSIGIDRGHLVLNAGTACGDIRLQSVEVAALNDVDLIDRPRAAFESVRRHCRGNNTLSLQDAAGYQVMELPCPSEFNDHPGLFQIEDLGLLATPL